MDIKAVKINVCTDIMRLCGVLKHLIRNERVAGSNPVDGSNKKLRRGFYPRLFYFYR